MTIVSGRIMAMVLGFMAVLVLASPGSSLQESWEKQPDQVLRPAASRKVEAGTPLQTFRFELGTEQVKDRWVRAIDFRPGDPRVVRRAFFYIEKTGQWLGSWEPGQRMVPFPDTVAAILPAGSRVIMEIQYQSAGEDVMDRSALALYFSERKPLRPLSGMGINAKVTVPAASDGYTIRKEFPVISDSYALAIHPEMFAAGRSLEVTSIDSAGAAQVLLSVKNFSKDVQPPYVFEEPLFIAKGTRIVATAAYQNFDSAPTEDLFKLTMSMYPSAEVHPVIVDAPAAAARKPVAKKAPVRKASARKVPAKTTAAKKP